MLVRWLAIVFSVWTLAGGCKEDSRQSPKAGPDPQRGRRIYLANCTACHNADPSLEGSAGPPIKGSSRELLEAKVLRSTYPPGYTPKRKSSAMPSYGHVRPAIADLASYLE
jgi:mono/diheme cytochrome c family protein